MGIEPMQRSMPLINYDDPQRSSLASRVMHCVFIISSTLLFIWLDSILLCSISPLLDITAPFRG